MLTGLPSREVPQAAPSEMSPLQGASHALESYTKSARVRLVQC